MDVLLKRSVYLGLVLLALIPVSRSACWNQEIQQGVTQCQDSVDKTWHEVGSNWRNSKCMQCSCSTSTLSCCDSWPTGSSEDCTIEYNYETCTYEVIEKFPGAVCSFVGK